MLLEAFLHPAYLASDVLRQSHFESPEEAVGLLHAGPNRNMTVVSMESPGADREFRELKYRLFPVSFCEARTPLMLRQEGAMSLPWYPRLHGAHDSFQKIPNPLHPIECHGRKTV